MHLSTTLSYFPAQLFQTTVSLLALNITLYLDFFTGNKRPPKSIQKAINNFLASKSHNNFYAENG